MNIPLRDTLIPLREQFSQRPYVIGNTSFHRWSHAQSAHFIPLRTKSFPESYTFWPCDFGQLVSSINSNSGQHSSQLSGRVGGGDDA
jgi:hypothetical protein